MKLPEITPLRLAALARLSTLAALCLLGSAPALSAPQRVEAFAGDSWQALQNGARPAAVVFSTTDCSYCPAAIAKMAKTLRQQKNPPPLVVVVMDGAGQESQLLKDPHYRQADRLMAFQGDPQALRYRVEPGWYGMTPYVVLLPRNGEAQHFVGTPDAPTIKAALQP